jgi:uncharacterized membrane protein
MSYLILIAGVALWSAAHLFKRLMPSRRAAMGEKGKGLVAVLLLVSIVLMVVGYRSAGVDVLWSPPTFLTHLNNLLMLIAVYFFVADGLRTWITTKVRHPQLTGFKTWAVGHLLVNGDLASVILFGGLLAWAVVSVVKINRAQPDWEAQHKAPGVAKEAAAIVITIVALVAIGWVHAWLGYWPYG